MKRLPLLPIFAVALVTSSSVQGQAPAPTPAPVAPPAAKPPAAPEMDPATLKTNSSYGFGYRTGRQFASQTSRFGITDADIEREVFVKGLFDAFTGQDPSITEEDINAAFNALQLVVQKREEELGAKNLAAGLKFLEDNGKREGVITTASGLQYEILTAGDGETYKAPAEPSGSADRTQFTIKYVGTLIDGTEFDSSKGNSVPMGMNTVPGFKEALTTMPVGSTWKIYLKPDLAYGEARRSPVIGPNSTLIFEVTLEGIIMPPAPAPPARRPTAVSPPVRVPMPPKDGERATAVSPPVEIVIPKEPKEKEAPAPEEKPAE